MEDKTLDSIFTDVPGVVTSNVGIPIGTSDHSFVSAVTSNVGIPIGTSDHSFVSAVIRTEQVVPEACSSR